MKYCLCGHDERAHSNGPGAPVSCGRVNCPCVRWREDKTRVHYERSVEIVEKEEEISG